MEASINIKNVKPIDLRIVKNPTIPAPSVKNPDTFESDLIKHLFINPLKDESSNKINPQLPLEIEMVHRDGSIDKVDENDIKSALFNWAANVDDDIELEKELKTLYDNMNIHYIKNDFYFRNILGISWLASQNQPLPSSTIRYEFSSDIKPASLKYLANGLSDQQTWNEVQSAFSGYFLQKNINDASLIVGIKDNSILKDISFDLTTIATIIGQSNTISQDTMEDVQLFTNSTMAVNNDAVTGYVMNNDDTLNSDDFTLKKLLQIVLSARDDVIIPFTNLKQLINPTSIVFLNIDKITKFSNNQELNKELSMIEDSIRRESYIKSIISTSKLKKLSKSNILKSGYTNKYTKSKGSYVQSKNTKLSGVGLSKSNQKLWIKNILKSQNINIESQNVTKSKKPTYMRPSRRDPFNVNLKGTIKKDAYKPDIHIFLDSSGSITEKMIKDSLINIITIAKYLNTNIYFTSFSHIISSTTLLKTKDRNVQDLYKMIMNIPRVGGGTEFENVYHVINKTDKMNTKKNKASRLNFIITDFAYSFNSSYTFKKNTAALKKTYYLPIKVEKNHVKYLSETLNDFCESAQRAGNINIKKFIGTPRK